MINHWKIYLLAICPLLIFCTNKINVHQIDQAKLIIVNDNNDTLKKDGNNVYFIRNVNDGDTLLVVLHAFQLDVRWMQDDYEATSKKLKLLHKESVDIEKSIREFRFKYLILQGQGTQLTYQLGRPWEYPEKTISKCVIMIE